MRIVSAWWLSAGGEGRGPETCSAKRFNQGRGVMFCRLPSCNHCCDCGRRQSSADIFRFQYRALRIVRFDESCSDSGGPSIINSLINLNARWPVLIFPFLIKGP